MNRRKLHFTLLLIWSVFSQVISVCAVESTPAGMVAVSGGVFKPMFRSVTDAKEVVVAPFDIDALPVTNEQFLEFVRQNPRWRRSAVKRLFADQSYLRNWTSDLEPGTNAPAKAPVTFVSWFAAKAYAQWRGKSLPTVAEWELVAAASRTQPDGEKDPEFTAQLAKWNSSLSETKLRAVGQQPANFWGAQDMHGLIWEWVSDFNTAMVTGDSRGDTGLDRQLFCGSASAESRDSNNFAAFMRYGFRSSLKADFCIHNLGFRCVRSIEK